MSSMLVWERIVMSICCCPAAALSCYAVVQERKHLAFTLKDTKTIVGKLERIAAFVFHILMFFFYLVIFNVSISCFRIISPPQAPYLG